MATPLRKSTDTLEAPINPAAQSLAIVELPEHFLERLFELMGPRGSSNVVLLSKTHLTILSTHPYWKSIYTILFRINPIPLGLTHFQATGTKWQRVSDFFNYRAQTPLAILYKKTALGGIKLQEFKYLHKKAQNGLNSFEEQLPTNPHEKCAAIAAQVKEKMQNMPPEKQNLVYWNLCSEFYKYRRKRMGLRGVPLSEFEFFGRRNALFNPIRLIDAVEIISNSPLLFKNDSYLLQKFLHLQGNIEMFRGHAPEQIPSQENTIEDFGTREAFPFCDLGAVETVETTASSDSEDLEAEESSSSSHSSSYFDTVATTSFEETS